MFRRLSSWAALRRASEIDRFRSALMRRQVVFSNAGAVVPLPLECSVAVDGVNHGAIICYPLGRRAVFDGPMPVACRRETSNADRS